MAVPAGHWLFFLTAAAMAQPGPVLYDFEGGFNLSSAKGYVIVEPGEADTLYVHFHRNKSPAYIPTYLKDMKGLPGGYTEHWEIIDLTKVIQIQVSVFNPGPGRSFVVDDIRAWNAYVPPKEAQLQSGLFPLLNTLDQYRHGTWPGKSKDINDIFVQAENEADDLIEHQGPEGWNACSRHPFPGKNPCIQYLSA